MKKIKWNETDSFAVAVILMVALLILVFYKIDTNTYNHEPLQDSSISREVDKAKAEQMEKLRLQTWNFAE